MGDIDLTMILRRSPPAAAIERPGLSLREETDLGIAKLRVFYSADGEARFRAITGIEPPRAGTRVEDNGLTFAWMAPGEWLVTGADVAVAAWLAQTGDTGGDDLLAIDFSHARTAFRIEGADAGAALAAHCPLDLCADSFPVGTVARSLLGDTGMFIARLDDGADGPCFRIIVDQTMAAYAARLLGRA